MTDNQFLFANEYLIDRNATRAYLAAYPHVKSSDVARKNGSRLLTNADVKAYIDEQIDKMASEKIADAKEVLEYLTSVIRGQSSSQIVVVEGTGDGCSEARPLMKAPDEKERLKAAELLGKHLGLLTNQVKLEAVPVIISGGELLED